MITPELAITRIRDFRLHPLGFFYLRIEAGEGITSRFHIWPVSEFGVPENECHQHTFDIRSKIWTGHMRSELFNFETDKEGSVNEFAVEYRGEHSMLSLTGRRGRLERICEFDSKAGASYFLRAGTIHRVSVIQRPCVTALETVDRAISIYSYGRDVAETPFDRRLVEPSEIAEIEYILRLLCNASQ